MLCIYNTSTDPYFNLATEEYLLKEFSEDCFMLWKNEPTVVVGKHQNTNAEINSDYVRANNINVVRRLTGGGAVYHDLGNLNFTFIMNGGEHKQINFEKYTRPVLEVLNKLGINAKFEGRNDLRIDGKKISGNSEHIYRNRILHHGTLLYSSNMEPLGKALNIKPLKYKGRGVKSLSSEVTNISQHLSKPVSLTGQTR